jgi:hypothetical protein
MDQLRAQLLGKRLRSGDRECEAPRRRDSRHLLAKRQPIRRIEPGMTEHDAPGACRKTFKRFPQPVTKPFVGHQPFARPRGLVRCHGCFYSALRE